MMNFSQHQAEGLCLRYPESFGNKPNLTYEAAVDMLLRIAPMSAQVPYTWGFIDKPPEGQIYFLFLPGTNQFPPDGIRYQEQETRFVIPVGNNRELEITEVKFGFIPGVDTTAFRVRRRFRLHKGGSPQIVLAHYSRGQSTPILPQLMNQPVRQYPLRAVNEPAVYILGEKVGQQVYTQATGPPPPQQQHPQPPQGMPPQGLLPHHSQQGVNVMAPMGIGGLGVGGGNMNMNIGGSMAMGMNVNPQVLAAQQNANMEAMEQRNRERARGRSGSNPGRLPAQPRIEDDDSADEADLISTRTLAQTRYKRNHELMNEVFYYAAFGKRYPLPKQPPPFSIFNQSDLDAKLSKLTREIDELKSRNSRRQDEHMVVDGS